MLKGSRQSQSPAPYQDRPYTFFTLAGSIASTQLHADIGTNALPTTHLRHAQFGLLPCAQVMQYLAGRAGSKAAGPGGTNAEEDEAARPRNAFARGSDHGDAAPIEEQVRLLFLPKFSCLQGFQLILANMYREEAVPDWEWRVHQVSHAGSAGWHT